MTDADRRTALVVDDSATVRAYHAAILREAGFAVDEASNGAEALERVLVDRHALAVVDVNMPVMDGFTLLEHVRRTPHGVGLPVVMVTTASREADATEAYRRGADLFVVKPVQPWYLARVALRLAAGTAPARAGRAR